jgi:FkbM family methyltransferase
MGKKFILPLLWWAGSVREKIYNILDARKPYLNKVRYCGFDLYYGKRSGIINRIRFGHRDRIYERALCDSIVKDLAQADNPVFLDIGANVGFISLYALSKTPGLTVYAFEPGLRQNTVLGITVFANHLEKCLVLSNQAVSDTIGTITFHEHIDEFESGGDGIIDTKRGGATAALRVPTVTLDIWWQENNRLNINVIKIDTEGAELFILRGAETVIKICQPVIYLEISLLNLKNYPYSAEDIYQWLASHGYHLNTIDGRAVDLNNLNGLATVEDSFVARPNK